MSSAIYLAGVGTSAGLPGTTATPVPLPSAWQPGDVAFLHVARSGSVAASGLTFPAGWTLIAHVNQSVTNSADLYYRVLQVGDSNPVVTRDATAGTARGVVSAYVGVAPGTLAAAITASLATTSGASGTSVSLRNPTAVDPGAMFLAFVSVDVGSILQTDLTPAQHLAYSGTGYQPLASAWGALPLNTQTPLVFDWTPAAPYIAMTVALPPADATMSPPVATLLDAFKQDPLRRDGAPIINPESNVDGRLVVEALNPSPYDQATWNVSDWDEDTWAGPGRWQDIAARVRSVAWSRGSESPLDRPRTGTATLVLDNRDGAASAWASGGEFSLTINGSPVGGTWLQPGTIVRIGAYFQTATALDATPEYEWLPFFTGTVETDQEGVTDFADSSVTLGLVELTAFLAGFDSAEQPSQGAGDTLAQRVARLLDQADWPADTAIEADSIGDQATFQATTMAQNRLGELDLVADSVGMRILAGSDGTLTFTAPYPDVDVTSDASFSNTPEGDELPVASVTPYASTDRIVNIAVAANAGSIEQAVRDWPSIDEFGPFGPGARDDLILQSDDLLTEMLQRRVAAGATDSLGIESVELDADQDPVNLPLLMAQYASTGLEARQPFNLRWVHPSTAVFPVALVIEGMTHTITPTEPGAAMKWTATLSTATRVFADAMTWDADFWDTNYWAAHA